MKPARLPSADRVIAAVCLAIGSWYWLQIVHELGHVCGAWLTGGGVRHVSLPPLSFSRTDIDPNPHPGMTAWAGPIGGVLFPFVIWLAALASRRGSAPMIGFWCGLCFVANGAYVGFGATDFIGDAGDIRRAGSPHALLMLFGLSCIAVGLISWHITAKTARAVPVDKRRPFLRSAILFAVSALIVVAVAAV